MINEERCDVVWIQRRSVGAARQVGHRQAAVRRSRPAIDHFGRDPGVARDLRDQVLPRRRRDDGPAACIRQSIADLTFRCIKTDRDDHRTGPQAGQARFDPIDPVRQVDGDPVSLADASFRQVGGDRRGIHRQLRVGYRAGRIPIGNLLRPFLRMPIEELSDRRDQVYVQHRSVSRQIMLNPPLMLIVCPVIQPPASEASSATIGATSEGWPRRRIA